MTKDELKLLKKVTSLKRRLPQKIENALKDEKLIENYKIYGERLHNYDIFSPIYHKICSYLWISAREALPVNQKLSAKLKDAQNNKNSSLQDDFNELSSSYTQYNRTRLFNDFLFKKLEGLEDAIDYGFDEEDTEEKLKKLLEDCTNGEDVFVRTLEYDSFYLPRHKQMIEQIFDDDLKEVYPIVLTTDNKERSR